MHTKYKTDDLRICEIKEVIAPADVHDEFPITEQAAQLIAETRADIHRILTGEDDRLLVIVGPCSIHDPKAAIDYAERLRALKNELDTALLIVMRVYFEKPRTTVGWKGLINDPDLDSSFNINKGLRAARRLLLEVNNLGVPAATEYLDLITPQYISDLISWAAIGARTTESQGHRELASGVSCPLGFKNSTDGTIKIAIDALGAAMSPHHFLSMTKAGRSAIFSTTGNADVHIILRGGNDRPNYDEVSVGLVKEGLESAGLRPNIMVDFSHANSSKQYHRQLVVGTDVAGQIAGGNHAIMGVMLESNIEGGNQKVIEGQPLVYGKSITDGCLSWNETAPLLKELADAVQKRRAGFGL